FTIGDFNVTGISTDDPNKFPKSFSLYPNYPNPFNPNTTIRYDLVKKSKVVFIIYNTLGQKVKTLINETQTAGSKSVIWDGTDNTGQSVSSGLFLYTLRVDDIQQSRKMLLIR
ncbi:MAG: T9SS type A sorting domain-containing protein, partial [Aliifodinibius sp.]|nr:T9SS type A sorting domain-containing protein [Fodinibius sp.]NIY28035.1 T9SS type A sorting domain-containing protein [Fodinibius sp.]